MLPFGQKLVIDNYVEYFGSRQMRLMTASDAPTHGDILLSRLRALLKNANLPTRKCILMYLVRIYIFLAVTDSRSRASSSNRRRWLNHHPSTNGHAIKIAATMSATTVDIVESILFLPP
jgi:hypothetical protein